MTKKPDESPKALEKSEIRCLSRISQVSVPDFPDFPTKNSTILIENNVAVSVKRREQPNMVEPLGFRGTLPLCVHG